MTLSSIEFSLPVLISSKYSISLFHYRPNVCKVREEDIEDETESNEGDKASSDVDKEDDEDTLIQAFQLNLETCVEKTNKYQCKKV